MFRPTFESNEELVDSLIARGFIETGRVEEAFRDVDRKSFVPEERKGEAYNDYALPIGDEATISGPHMVAINTELLDIDPGNNVVEIGSGSGYQLAILSELAGDSGTVVGVELNQGLVEKSAEKLEDRENVKIFCGSGFEPVGDREFDRILFSCAVESLEEFLGNLKDPGVMVAPVNEDDYQVVKRFRDGKITRHQRVRFVDFREE